MTATTWVAASAALLGGVVLVANLFLGLSALSVGGLALVAVATAAAGTRLVRRPPLQLVTAAGSVALAWALLETLRAFLSDARAEAAAGAVATLAVAAVVLRGSGSAPGRGNRRGNSGA